MVNAEEVIIGFLRRITLLLCTLHYTCECTHVQYNTIFILFPRRKIPHLLSYFTVESALCSQPLCLIQNLYEVQNSGYYSQTSVNTAIFTRDLLYKKCYYQTHDLLCFRMPYVTGLSGVHCLLYSVFFICLVHIYRCRPPRSRNI